METYASKVKLLFEFEPSSANLVKWYLNELFFFTLAAYVLYLEQEMKRIAPSLVPQHNVSDTIH